MIVILIIDFQIYNSKWKNVKILNKKLFKIHFYFNDPFGFLDTGNIDFAINNVKCNSRWLTYKPENTVTDDVDEATD